MNRKTARGLGLYFVIFLIIMAAVFFFYDKPEDPVKEIPFSQMITELANENVKSVHMDQTKFQAVLKKGDTSVVSYSSTTLEAKRGLARKLSMPAASASSRMASQV